MTSRRWLARLTVPMLVGAALVTGAASAGASPADDAYLGQLRGAGFTWPPGHEQALIGMAYLICDDLGWGWTPDHIAQHVHANLDQDSVALGQVGSMVNSAHSIYLPQPAVLGPSLLSGPGCALVHPRTGGEPSSRQTMSCSASAERVG